MNYRHAYHAGNHGDVLKHVVLLACLDHLKQKPAPFAVLDTHAGRGFYDLGGDEAMRGGEWRAGALRLWAWREAPACVQAYVAALHAANPDGDLKIYPGSPALIAGALRAGDRLAACELHKADAAAARRAFRAARNVHVHARDGWEALGALLPFPERRGLIVIDPPYEAPDELARAARAVRAAHAKFNGGMVLWWRPLKDESALARADAEALAHGGEALRIDLAIAPPTVEGPLTASSLLLVNPPHTLAATLAEAGPALAERLGGGAGRFTAGALPL